MTDQKTDIRIELALLLALATLWGASYTLIKISVETIPPVTLIAAGTLVAGAILLFIIKGRGLDLPKDFATWRRFLFQACLNSVIPFTLIARAERTVDAGLGWADTRLAYISFDIFCALGHINRRVLIGGISSMSRNYWADMPPRRQDIVLARAFRSNVQKYGAIHRLLTHASARPNKILPNREINHG